MHWNILVYVFRFGSSILHKCNKLLHPAAADHSVSISRQQVQCIFRFSLRSRAGDPAAQRWYSSHGDGTWRLRSLLQGTRVTYVTETFPISRSLRVTSGDRRIGIPTKRPRILPLPVPCGSLLRPYFLAQVRASQEDQLLLLWHYPLSKTG